MSASFSTATVRTTRVAARCSVRLTTYARAVSPSRNRQHDVQHLAQHSRLEQRGPAPGGLAGIEQQMPPDRDRPERHQDRCQGREDKDRIGATEAPQQQGRSCRPKRQPRGRQARKARDGQLQPGGSQVGDQRGSLRAPLVDQRLRSWVASCHTNGSARMPQRGNALSVDASLSRRSAWNAFQGLSGSCSAWSCRAAQQKRGQSGASALLAEPKPLQHEPRFWNALKLANNPRAE